MKVLDRRISRIDVQDAQTVPALRDVQAGQKVRLTIDALVLSVSVDPVDVTGYGDTGLIPKITSGRTTVTLAVQEIT